MKKWLNKQMSAFVLGFLDTEMNYRSTTDDVVLFMNQLEYSFSNRKELIIKKIKF